MADGHPSSCAHATIGSVCHCECSGVRHSVAINGGVPAPASAKKGAKGTPTEGYAAPASTPEPTSDPEPDAAPSTQPATEPSAEPPTADATTTPGADPADFERRAAEAIHGDEALLVTPASLTRPTDSGLTPAQFEAFELYRAEFYTDINGFIRGDRAGNVEIRQWIADMDAAMETSRTRGDIVTWRGVQDGSHMFGDRLGEDLTGAEWDEQAYLSTSAEQDIANVFVNDASDRSNAVAMRILVPSGTGAVTLSGAEDPTFTHDPESEVLLRRGLRLRVVADRGRDDNGVRLLDVEVVPA